MNVQTATVTVSNSLNGAGAKAFSNRLSECVLDGWEILSSGFDGHQWWAIIQKVEES